LELDVVTTKAHPKSVLRRLRRADVLPLMRAIRQSAQGLAALRHTCQVDLPRAGCRDVQIHAAPTRADGGGVLWHGVLTDITEQLLAALQLQSLTVLDLEAQRKTAMRNEFLSRVSHEFRTPLNAILGFSQLIRLQGPAQPMAALLGSVQHIEHAGTHLLALVNDMLDLAGLEAGSAAMHLEPVLLAPLVEESVALLGPLAQHRRISFQVSQTGHIPAVQGDERAVRQILFNLFGNAIKFAHPASVVRVHLRQATGVADVAIEITDEGPGIAADALDSLFMPFPGGNVPRNRLSGTGLGRSHRRAQPARRRDHVHRGVVRGRADCPGPGWADPSGWSAVATPLAQGEPGNRLVCGGQRGQRAADGGCL
jgi:signal transduction histidine kinase